ncbi:fluoride efflux transporter FluC [Pseudoclavibacter sp. 13-3]|uniref:fluoride efflux transporter FluC n=1 Tax=Pseudoclavibacter sp. 13-3 TaxID=2901228 RepID=UPI001E4623C0|nr:CrcB family protein [Pseudoclavibacter sp. 13-3]MCD7102157.1 CrcB family protein [Pseudoclavibacter sp. 13-3]
MVNVRDLLQGIWPVAVGGMIGTAARASIETALPVASGWPWPTFLINIGGALVLGLLTGLLARGAAAGLRRLLRLGVGTGIIGGFTTYSTFVMEVDLRLAEGSATLAMLYALGSILIGVAAAVVGLVMGRRAVRA